MGFWDHYTDKPLKAGKDLLAQKRRDMEEALERDRKQLERLRRNGIVPQEYYHVTPTPEPLGEEVTPADIYKALGESLDALERKPPPKVMKIDPKREARRGHAT